MAARKSNVAVVGNEAIVVLQKSRTPGEVAQNAGKVAPIGNEDKRR